MPDKEENAVLVEDIGAKGLVTRMRAENRGSTPNGHHPYAAQS